MQRNQVKELIEQFSFQYGILLTLPPGLKLTGLGSFFLFYLLMIVIIQTTLGRTLMNFTGGRYMLLTIYTSVLFEFLLFSINTLTPRLRPYRKIFTAIFVAIVVAGSGFAIFYFREFRAYPIPPEDFLLGVIGLLSAFGSTALFSMVMNAVVREKAGMETEIRLARRIHEQLVPSVDLQRDNHKVYGCSATAHEIGGDFFDVVSLADSRLVVAVGDVSGHNLAAGLVMALVKGAFRTAVHTDIPLDELCASLNRTVREHASRTIFMSFSCAVFDFKKQTVRLVNAGHLPLLHRKGDEIREWNARGIALGLMAQTDYEICEVAFAEGDTFLFLTDGLTEAADPDQQEFGIERIRQLMERERLPGPLVQEIKISLDTFRGEELLEDDYTLVAVQA